VTLVITLLLFFGFTIMIELYQHQKLTPDDLIKISNRYGNRLEEAPIQEHGRTTLDGYPQIYVVSNIIDTITKKPIGSLGSGEAVWHTDMSYLQHPPIYSLLYAITIPETGGDTWFCDMVHALKTLPYELRSNIENVNIYHDGKYNSGGLLRQTDVPGTFHPAIITLPNGESALYLGRRNGSYIDGLSKNKSDELLDALWNHATSTDNVYKHKWTIDDLVVFDNRRVMHRRDAFNGDRLLYRTQIR
jgi:taurine dioxygenase